MTETELERLVVRLTGDGSSYQRMVEQADAGNKRLESSLKKVEEAQKRADEQTKKAEKTWVSFATNLHGTVLALDLISKGFDDAGKKASELKMAVSSLGSELIKTAAIAAQHSGYLPEERTGISRASQYFNVSNYVEAGRVGLQGLQRNLSGARQQEMMPYYQRRHLESERRAIGEQQDEFSEEARQRGRIEDPTRRSRAINAAIDDAQRRMDRARENVESTKGNGARARYERLDSNWQAKMRSRFDSLLSGKEDPYQKQIEEANKALEKGREELERMEDLWRKIKKEAKETEKGMREGRDSLEKNATDNLRESRMSPEELRADKYRKAGFSEGMVSRFETMHESAEENKRKVSVEEDLKRETKALKEQADMYGLVGMKAKIALAEKRGVSPSVIAAFKVEATNDLGRDGRKMLDDIRDETDEIGMSSREKRDKRAIEKLREAGHSEETISGYRSRMEARDAAEDADELGTKVKTLVTHLEEQAEALKKNRDPMDQYTSMLSKASDAQKEMVRNAVESVKKGELQRTGDRVTERFGDPKSRLIDEQKELKKLLDANAISADTYARAMAELARSMSSVGSASSSISRSIDSSISGSSDAYDRLMEFREGAFAAKGDNRGPISTTTPIAARKQKSLARMARERQIAMKKKPGKDPSRLGKDDKAGASDYWAADQAPDAFENTRFWREDGMEASKSETAGESKEDTMQVLERIAKAVEKDAEVKVSVSSLK